MTIVKLPPTVLITRHLLTQTPWMHLMERGTEGAACCSASVSRGGELTAESPGPESGPDHRAFALARGIHWLGTAGGVWLGTWRPRPEPADWSLRALIKEGGGRSLSSVVLGLNEAAGEGRARGLRGEPRPGVAVCRPPFRVLRLSQRRPRSLPTPPSSRQPRARRAAVPFHRRGASGTERTNVLPQGPTACLWRSWDPRRACAPSYWAARALVTLGRGRCPPALAFLSAKWVREACSAS